MHRKFTSLLLSALMLISTLVLIVPTETEGEVTLNEEWVARYNGPKNSNDFATAIAVDSSDNVYVTGTSYGINSSIDYLTIAYDSSGNVLWTNRYNGPGNDMDYARAITADSSGIIYVTGESSGGDPIDGGTDDDYATVAYDSTGNELWVARYSGPRNGQDRPTAIITDNNGHIYVTGGGDYLGSTEDITTIAYDSNGSELWVAIYDGPEQRWDIGRDIALDEFGNIYVTGTSWGGDPNKGGTSHDFITVAYDSSGKELWNVRYNSPANSHDYGGWVEVHSNGYVYVGGVSKGSDGYHYYTLIAYDPNGNEQWVRNYRGGSGSPHDMTMDHLGHIYMTGEDHGITTIAYDSLGNQLWVMDYHSPWPGRDWGHAIAARNTGEIVVTGRSMGDGTSLDYYTILYDLDGNEIWNASYNGPANGGDEAADVTFDSLGNIYVTGKSDGVGTLWDYATVKYSPASSSQPPNADAGPDQTVYENDIVILDGSNSTGGTLLGYTPPSDMISWWPGDLNATDIADGNHGTLLSGTTYGTGMVDEAFKFDGINDVVGVADSESLKITGSISIDAWLYIQSFPSPSQGHGLIIFRGDSRSALDPYYLSAQPGGYIRFHVESTSSRKNLEAPIDSNKWVFIAATLDDTTGKMRIYIDGVLTAETTTSIRPFANLHPSYHPGVGIGNHNPGSSHNFPFHGLIDEMELFDRALTVSEIQGIYNAGSSGKRKTPDERADIISYEWDFESDGIYDYQETTSFAPDGAFDGITDHVYVLEGNYTVTLRIIDETNATDTDTCIISVLPLYKPPIADAGEDQVVNEGDVVVLDGSNSRTYNEQLWDPSIVALWHMNENSGNILYDSTPYKNHGTIMGANWTTDGKWGNALSFDGIDDNVEVKPSNEIFGENPDEWSYSVWFKTTNDEDYMPIITDFYYNETWAHRPGDQNVAVNLYTEISTSSDKEDLILTSIQYYREDIGYGHGHGIGARCNYSDDKWHLAVVTVSKTDRVNMLFIDGFNGTSRYDMRMGMQHADFFDGDMLRIGTSWGRRNWDEKPVRWWNYNGTLDEIILWNRALSPLEVLDYYNSRKEYYANYSSGASLISYQWDFESDGIYDYQETTTFAPDGTFDGIAEHVYGDNGNFTATLRVTDSHNLTDTDICNITVLNVNPTLEIESAEMEVEIGLRVAGRKFNDVGLTLYENGTSVSYVSVERMPGSPDDQMAWIPMTLDMTKTYTASVTYTPEDPPNIGGNPVWIYMKFPNGSIQKIHHTFNVQQSKKRNSTHWNHVEPWEVDLNAHLIGWAFELKYRITDPGSDDIILTCNYGSQNMIVEHLNNPPNPDPYPSPEVNPRDILSSTTLVYEGTGELALSAEDDDGGSDSKIVHLA